MSAGSTSVSGIVGAGQPEDYYAFALARGETVSLTLALAAIYSADTLTLSLFDAAGRPIATAPATTAGDGSIVQALPAGQYYVGVAGTGADAYGLMLTDSVPTVGSGPLDNTAGSTPATALPLGTLGSAAQDLTGWVGSGAAQAIYTFQIAGDAAFAATLSGLAGIATLTLEDAGGTVIATTTGSPGADASLKRLLAPLPSGSYRLVIGDDGGLTAASGYHLAVAAAPVTSDAGTAAADALPLGVLGGTPTDIADMVGVGGATGWYGFSLEAASQVAITLGGLSAAATLTLWNADGTTEIAAVSAGSLADATAVQDLAAGSYFATVSMPGSGEATALTLAAQAVPLPAAGGAGTAAPDALGTLAAPVTLTGQVGPQHTADVFGFTLAAAATLDLSLSAYGSGLVPGAVAVALLAAGAAPSAALLASTAASGAQDGLLAVTLGPGSYFAAVTPDGAGIADYALTLATGVAALTTTPGTSPQTAPDLGVPPAAGVTYVGTVDSTLPDAEYGFTLDQTSLVHLDLTGIAPTGAAGVFLRGGPSPPPYGAAMPGQGGSVVQVLAPGSYAADVQASYGSTGFDLTLAAVALPAAAGTTAASARLLPAPSATPESVAGYVGPGMTDAVYAFTLDGRASVELHLSGLSGIVGATLDLLAADGNALGTATGGAASDAWVGADLAAGTYDVTVQAAPDPASTQAAAIASQYTLAIGAVPISDAAGGTPAGAAWLGTLDAACFAAGTRIATADGETAVERLCPGDRIRLLHGGSAPVIWVGHRTVDCRRHPRPQDVWPVRVAAGAVAPGVPSRDLWLSPDHAVLLDGVLVPVRYLLNGRSIAQVRRAQVRYLHVELPRHAVLLAEGMPAESYLDTGNRGAFANGGRAGRTTAEAALRIWHSAACAPLLRAGGPLAAIRARLLERAAALGHARTPDPALAILANSRPLAIEGWGSRCSVRLPPATRAVRILSRSAVPAETRPESSDRRRLGVALRHLVHAGRMIPLDDARLGRGWHAAEGAGGVPDFRWTDGDARLALHGGGWLEIVLAATETYWADAPPRQRVMRPTVSTSSAILRC